MNDMLKEFGDSGARMAAGPIDYAHPMADAIISECTNLLLKIPEGQRLLAYQKDKGITLSILAGKKVDWQVSHDENKAVIFCPANTKAVDIQEMAMAIGIAIREMEHKDLGIHHPAPHQNPEMAQQIMLNYFLDMNMEMCKIVSEFEKVDGNIYSKFLDLVKKLGQDEFYREYVSGKSQEELKETLKKTLTK